MIKRILLASIPNTGTKYVVRMLNNAGYIEHECSEEPKSELCVHFTHIINPHYMMLAYYMSKEMPTIIPLRHPYVTAKSWIDRKQDIVKLCRAYRNLVKYFPNAFYFPVDVTYDEKLVTVRYLQELINPNIKYICEIINSVHGNEALRYHNITNPDPMVVDLINEIMPFLWDKYYK